MRRTSDRGAAATKPRFAQTPDFTVGVEEEFQLVDPDTAALVSRPSAVDAASAASEGRLQAEIFEAMLETTTPVCADVTEMGEQMRRLRSWGVEAGSEHGFALAAAGTHPFACWETEARTSSPRYERLVSSIQLPLRSDLVFGQHVHVSVGSPEEAIRVTNDVRAYLPLLIALSANSPFWRGIDSGLASGRVNVSAGMPRSGLPPTFEGWESFEAYLDTLASAGAIDDVTELWWDVRPRADLGTVEVRVADQPTDVETSIALAGLTLALVEHLARRARRGDPPPIEPGEPLLRENRWNAVRNGLQARFIEPRKQGAPRVASVASFWARTVQRLAPQIDRLGIQEQIHHLDELVAGGTSGADRQRDVHRREGDLQAVVRDVVERTPP